jgi:hypothetical protein
MKTEAAEKGLPSLKNIPNITINTLPNKVVGGEETMYIFLLHRNLPVISAVSHLLQQSKMYQVSFLIPTVKDTDIGVWLILPKHSFQQ